MGLLGTACSSGSSPTPPPLVASITGVELPDSIQGDVPLQIEFDSNSTATVDLAIEVSRDGGSTYAPARLASAAEGLDLEVGSTAITILWDSLRDAGFRDENGVSLRITPTSSEVEFNSGFVLSVPPADNLALATRSVRSHVIYYGALDPATIAVCEVQDLVVIQPGPATTALEIAEIQNGVDAEDPADDVIVLAYISIGEDLRTVNLTDAQLLADARFVGDGTGPRIDPRGPDADGQSLVGLNPGGLPSNGGTGFAPWYMDDNSVDASPTDTGDGLPDRNQNFGGCFVNPGDPDWFEALDAMTLDGVDGLPGMREILSPDHGRNLACDGLFLDTIDTAAPNSFTSPSSSNPSEFEWTAAGVRLFLERLEGRYPDAIVLQNRGVFYYDARHPQYEVNPRSYVDLVLYESFRLDSSAAAEFDPFFYADNRFNIAPKLLAEAGRSDGFVVLSLGYAEGPPASMSTLTLTGASILGFDSLMEDIQVTESELGFRHYLTDAGIQIPNTFVQDNRPAQAEDAPRWSSTYNDNNTGFPTPPLEATPRVGVQAVIPGPGSVTVRWDVALDSDPIEYDLYFIEGTFNFAQDPELATATRQGVTGEAPSDYANYGLTSFANEFTVTGLTPGTTYSFLVRASDAAGNQEQNQVTLSGVPQPLVNVAIDGSFADWSELPVAHVDPADVADSAGPDWLEIRIANDAQNLYIYFTSENAFALDGSPTYSFSRSLILIDVDDDPLTGYAGSGDVGSELLISGADLFSQAAGNFNTGFIEALDAAPVTTVTECEIAIPLQHLFDVSSSASRLRLLFINDEVSDNAPDSGFVEYSLSL